MTIIESFCKYMETLGVGTLGQDIFIGEAPSSKKAQDSLWWVLDSGGSRLSINRTGESLKQYSLNVYYRDIDYKQVAEKMFEFEESISCSNCAQLEGFQVVEIEVISYPVDQDLDSEDRKVGLLQVNIKTYKSC